MNIYDIVNKDLLVSLCHAGHRDISKSYYVSRERTEMFDIASCGPLFFYMYAQGDVLKRNKMETIVLTHSNP